MELSNDSNDQSIIKIKNPLSPRLILDLYIAPKKFFSNSRRIIAEKQIVLVTLIIGMTMVIDKIDRKIGEGVIESWGEFIINKPFYFGIIFIGGAISGLFYWAVGGWWYKLRMIFSGIKDFDSDQAQDVFIFSSFVYALPMILVFMTNLIIYPNAIEAYNQDMVGPLVALIFLFWSIVISYMGIKTKFNVSNFKIVIWFLVLPIIVNLGMILIVAQSLVNSNG